MWGDVAPTAALAAEGVWSGLLKGLDLVASSKEVDAGLANAADLYSVLSEQHSPPRKVVISPNLFFLVLPAAVTATFTACRVLLFVIDL